MHDALLAIALTFGVIGLGLALAASRTRGTSRELAARLEALTEGVQVGEDSTLTFTYADRSMAAARREKTWTLTTPVPRPPLPYPAAARALGDGRLIAALAAPGVACEPPRLSLELATARLKARSLRHQLERLAALASALERLPLDAALSRHLLDRAPEEERLSLFATLVSAFPESHETRRCALALADDQDPGLRGAAARVLETTGAGPVDGSAIVR